MISKSYIDAFIPADKQDADCTTCGLCLRKCPVMKMDKTEAREEIGRLLSGEAPARVLDECTFCYSCNSFCPEGLRPYSLIMERMVEKNQKEGKSIPASAEYMMTGKGESGYFYDLYAGGSEEDKAIREKWAKVPEASEDTLFIGCYGRSVPQGIENSEVLSELPKFGPKSACCGEIAHRYGDYAFFTQTVDRTYEMLSSLKTKRLVCYCGSCSNYLGNVWPNYHGVKLPFQVISLYEWLWEKVKAGDLQVQKQFENDMTIADSCYSSELGDGFYEALRGLYETVCGKPVELENNKYNSLCCGFATSIRNGFDHEASAKEGLPRFKQIMKTGTGHVGVNCPGCWASIHGTAKATQTELKIHYAVNFFLKAFGDSSPAAG